jgi:anaphase-promoting complex subunit 4
LSSETGAPLQIFRQIAKFQDDSGSGQAQSVQCIGWGMSLVDPSIIKSKRSAFDLLDSVDPDEPEVSFDDLLDRELDIEAIGVTAELSDQLAQFDALELMPKLPIITLPTSPMSRGQTQQSSLGEVFASQALLDAALRKSSSQELHALNSFLVSNQNGVVRLVVYDSLSIGNISPPFQPGCQVQYIGHSFHPFAHCHVLLAEFKKESNTATALVPLSFRFLKQSGKNVHLIASKTAQLEILFQYVGETILAIDQHWKSSRDLPSRFQANISETLAEKEEPNFAASIFQLAATGYCSPALKEWLVEELTDRVS